MIKKALKRARLLSNFIKARLSLGSSVLKPLKLEGLEFKDNIYRVTGPIPHFILTAAGPVLPCGWTEFSLLAGPNQASDFILYVDSGRGYSEEAAYPLSFKQKSEVLLALPLLVQELRLDPAECTGFGFYGLQARSISTLQVLKRYFLRTLKTEGHLAALSVLFKAGADFIRGGMPLLSHRLLGHETPARLSVKCYKRWIKKYDTLSSKDRRQIGARIKALPLKPLISVIMPVFNPQNRWLKRAIQSVQAQLYPFWELCLADDGSTEDNVRPLLEQYARQDSRIKVLLLEKSQKIAGSSNAALSLASGEFVALLDHDDELSEHALYLVAEAINRHPYADLIYSDEDRIGEDNQRRDPYFKPDWNEELALGQNYISHLGVYRRSLINQIGAFRPGFEGSQDWDLMLRFSEKTAPHRIVHLPFILYHWRLTPGSVSFVPRNKKSAFEAGKLAVIEHLTRRKIQA